MAKLIEKLYFSYRQIHWNRNSGAYDLSYYNDKQYADFKESWLTKMTDWDRFIPSDRITAETYPWIKTLRKVGMLEYNPAVDWAELSASLINVGKSFGVEVLTAVEMKAWILSHTDLVETIPWTFLIHEAHIDIITGEEVPAQYLTI